MIEIENFLWSKIPDDLADQDSYKDDEGKGLLERTLSVYEEELQQELIIPLENFAIELSPETASDKFLTELAFTLGNPPDVMGGVETYRKVLTNIISIYKIKGTIPSYRRFFNLFGLGCIIVEHLPPDHNYDEGSVYDEDDEDLEMPYDQNQFNVGYLEYSLWYYNLIGSTTAPLTEDLENRLKQAVIDLLQPIDCQLRVFEYLPELPENYESSLDAVLDFVLVP